MYRNFSRASNSEDFMKKLNEFIKDELHDNLYYQKLSTLAIKESHKKLLLEIANDEKEHANAFINIMKLYDKNYVVPTVEVPNITLDFKTAIINRILSELADYKKYGKLYLSAQIKELADLYFNIRTDENIHAHKLTIILSTI